MGVRFITRRGCSLCEERIGIVRTLSRIFAVPLTVEELTHDDPAGFSERIPVVCDENGNVLLEGAFGRGSALRTLWKIRRG